MLQIDDTIVSLALIEKKFLCDLSACRAAVAVTVIRELPDCC
jgi:hypothetical protein